MNKVIDRNQRKRILSKCITNEHVSKDNELELQNVTNYMNTSEYYFFDILGFTKIVYPQHSVENGLKMLESCYIMRQNPQFKFKLNTVWCIDGVSATGKSSVFENIVKTNKTLYLASHNTNNACALGYFFTSLEQMLKNHKESTIYDRTPFNNYTWMSIWSVLSRIVMDYRNNRSNSRNSNISTDEILEAASEFVVRCNNLSDYLNAMSTELEEFMYSQTNNIIIVDSNEDAARKRLQNRGEGSDVQRSKWADYIKLQNLFYYHMATKYPQHFILVDLNVFKGDLGAVQTGIRHIIYDNMGVDAENVPEDFKMSIDDREHAKFEKCNPVGKQVLLTRMGEANERVRPCLNYNFTDVIKMDLKQMMRNSVLQPIPIDKSSFSHISVELSSDAEDDQILTEAADRALMEIDSHNLRK